VLSRRINILDAGLMIYNWQVLGVHRGGWVSEFLRHRTMSHVRIDLYSNWSSIGRLHVVVRFSLIGPRAEAQVTRRRIGRWETQRVDGIGCRRATHTTPQLRAWPQLVLARGLTKPGGITIASVRIGIACRPVDTLLVANRFHRVDLRASPRGDIGGNQGRGGYNKNDYRVSQRVGCLHAV
jgi:hypothetical protein